MTAKSKTQCPRKRSSGAQKPLPPSRNRKLPIHSFQTFSILINNFPFSLQASRVSGRRRSTHRYPGRRRSRRIQAQATTSAPNFPEVSETLNLQANVSCAIEIPTEKQVPMEGGGAKGTPKRHSPHKAEFLHHVLDIQKVQTRGVQPPVRVFCPRGRRLPRIVQGFLRLLDM
jgi:hypothetical protein